MLKVTAKKNRTARTASTSQRADLCLMMARTSDVKAPEEWT